MTLVALRTISPSYSPMRAISAASSREPVDVDLEPVLAEGVDADGLQGVGDEDALHDFSAKIFWAPRTPAPKSTGWPRSASTCSSAARATITSNSAA